MVPAGVSELERDYAEFAKTNFAVAVNSGTAALHLALVALGVGKGDEVIVPDFTMAACAFAVSYTGAMPVFVDCKHDLTINEELIEAHITRRTKAIMPVHIYGRLCNMTAIRKIAKDHNLKVIEDGCEAQGATDGKSDVSCFSFYKNKIIHAEEGGIICTNDKHLWRDMQYLKNLAFGDKHDYFHEMIGYNYRMPEAMAKMAHASLVKYPENLDKRREVESWYASSVPSNLPPRDAVWVFDFLSVHKEDIMKRAKKHDVSQIRDFFKPMSSMPMYVGPRIGDRARFYSENGMYLPVYPDMTKEEVWAVCEKLKLGNIHM